MERGDVRQELNTTQPEQPTQDFLKDSVRKMAQELGIDESDLPLCGAYVTYDNLQPKHNLTGTSDNRLAILWHDDHPVALALETRTESNFVLTQSVYFGIRRQEDL